VASYSWLGDLGVACAGEARLTWPSRAASGVETAMPIAKPELVNEDAEGAGWIFKIKLAEPSEFDVLLDREAYLAYGREQG
jgi:Glycine cleavage H-protein